MGNTYLHPYMIMEQVCLRWSGPDLHGESAGYCWNELKKAGIDTDTIKCRVYNPFGTRDELGNDILMSITF